MIVGIGIDLVEIERIKRAAERRGERFLGRIYTPVEVEYCKSMKRSEQHLAGRWAAKEAAAKALGTGIFGSIRFRDIEITNDEKGKPLLALTGDAARIAGELGAARFHVSIAHSDTHATAVVVMESVEGVEGNKAK